MLTERKIENLPIKDRPYKKADGHGLYLLVTPAANKLWRMNYKWLGKQKTLSLGVWPVVSLEDARALALAARKKLMDGVDPAARQTPASQFSALALVWLERQTVGEKRRESLWRYLNRDLLPAIGTRKLDSLTVRELDDLLSGIAGKKSVYAGHICKHILNGVFLLGLRRGYCQINPVAMLDGVLPPERWKHYPALLDPAEIKRLFEVLESCKLLPETRAALMILPYVFTRPSELRLAQWHEFDFAGNLWTIPAERMKLRKDHLVPLSAQVIAMLESQRERTGEQAFVFWNRHTGKPITSYSIERALWRTELKGRQTPHGFRAMARTILHERLHFSPDAIEAQLAHAVPDRLGATYNRAQHLEERKKMMQVWADYLDNLRK